MGRLVTHFAHKVDKLKSIENDLPPSSKGFSLMQELFDESNLSLLARSSVKVFPILSELQKLMIPEEDSLSHRAKSEGRTAPGSRGETRSASVRASGPKKSGRGASADKMRDVPLSKFLGEQKIDMRNLLGYLNQSDWIWSLNIGNIMQISPLTMQDLYSTCTIEFELSRDVILEKVDCALPHCLDLLPRRFLLLRLHRVALPRLGRQREIQGRQPGDSKRGRRFTPD